MRFIEIYYTRTNIQTTKFEEKKTTFLSEIKFIFLMNNDNENINPIINLSDWS